MVAFELRLHQSVGQEQSPLVSPHRIQVSTILQLSAQQLERAIARELAENPALEADEAERCQVCGAEQQAGDVCIRCLSPRGGYDFATEGGWERDLAAGAEDDGADIWSRVSAEPSLRDRLLSQLCALLPVRDQPIAEYLVGGLDDDGYFRLSLDEVAAELEVSRDRVRAILGQLQQLDPPGVGARSLRECLLIQLDHLEREEGRTNPVARQILELNLLDELRSRQHRPLARMLGVSASRVEAAVAFIGRELTPFPARLHWDREPGGRAARPGRSLPDLVIIREGDAFRVEVAEFRRSRLRVTTAYWGIAGEMRRAPVQFSEGERRHVQEYLRRSQLFLRAVGQRHETMRKIGEVLVDEQRDYLLHGVRYLRPLSRERVAERLGFDQSTVCRATMGKYAMLPDRSVVPMSTFFSANLGPKDVIREIIKQSPGVSDSRVAELLESGHGIRIARRTVAKYRNELRILPAHLR